MKLIKNFVGTLLIAITITAGRNQSLADNLLQNPGFETGDFTGWTVGGTSPTNGVGIVGTPIPACISGTVIVHSGTYAAYAAVDTLWPGPNHPLILSQTVPVVPGNTYDIGFWMGFGGVRVGDGGSAITVNSVSLNILGHGIPPDFYEFWDATWTAPAGVTSALVTFNLAASGDGTAGISFDDFQVATVLTVTAVGMPLPGQFQLQFTGNPDSNYTVLGTTNASLSLTNWTAQGSVVKLSNGLFQFVDTQATNYPQRFYKVRSP
jgi:hypothetical protein